MFESQYLSFLPQAISCAVLSAAYFQAAAMRQLSCGRAEAHCPQRLYNSNGKGL